MNNKLIDGRRLQVPTLKIDTKIIDGKAIAENVKLEVKQRAQHFAEKYGRKPHIAMIVIGSNPASEIYVRNKNKDCEDCDIDQTTYKLPDTTQERLEGLIHELNATETVDAILVQMPLPKNLDAKAIQNAIAWEKDADGFGIENAGRLWSGIKDAAYACTPNGIRHMLHEYVSLESLKGKHAVIVNRSNIVGKPMAAMLLDMDMTVTICHSKTENIKAYTKTADLLVTAVGQPGFIKPEDIKPGAIIIDVSMNRDEHNKLCGDCEDLTGVAGYITPVPGGVGPMTRAMLMQNIISCAYKKHT